MWYSSGPCLAIEVISTLGWRMQMEAQMEAILLNAWGISPMPLSTQRQGISPQTPHDLMNLPKRSMNPLSVQIGWACSGMGLSQLYWQLQMMYARQSSIFLLFLTSLPTKGRNIWSRPSKNYWYNFSSIATISLSNSLVEFMSNSTFIYFWQIFISLCRLDNKCFFYSSDRSVDQNILPFDRGTCFIWLLLICRMLFTKWKSIYLSMSACFRHSQVMLDPRKKQGSMSMLYPRCFLFSTLCEQNFQFPQRQPAGVMKSYIFSRACCIDS